MKYLKYLILIGYIACTSSCNYLDVIPDNTSTLEHAFADATTAERYLFTCYAGLPQEYNSSSDPAMVSSNEYWQGTPYAWSLAHYITPFRIKDGYQNANTPYIDNYAGANGGTSLYKTIRKCYTFQDNIEDVFGLNPTLKNKWIAESKVIIAYCYFYLIRQYGPVPIIDQEYPVDATTESIRKQRNTMDECVQFIVNLINEAELQLPLLIDNRAEELGRFTKPIALSIKAKTLLLAASPLFNGNQFLADWTNGDGTLLLSPYSEVKWDSARVATKKAIEIAHAAGAQLYKYESSSVTNRARIEDQTIRGGVTSRDWEDELIWGAVPSGSTNNVHQLQLGSIVNFNGYPDNASGNYLLPVFDVTLNTAEKFYTDNGIPIEEDPEWANKLITDLRMPTEEEQDYVVNEINCEFNLSREPRFYSTIAFNRAKWYGNGKQGDEFHNIQLYAGNHGNRGGETSEWGSKTGMRAKKLVNLETTLSGSSSTATFAGVNYPFPRVRLADLYLMYAEAANEVGDPAGDAISYINLVRERAGLDGVIESWAKSNNVAKPTTKDGLREIIRQERDIELAFEGHHFWDARRWMILHEQSNKVLYGWNANGKTAEEFYVEDVKTTLTFTLKDYLWPIGVNSIIKNPLLVQAKGW